MTAPLRPLKELFLSALEVAPDDRADWLDSQCAGDAGLRQQLNLMLAAHDAPHSLLDQPAIVEPGATLDQPITERPGTQIGPYKLLQQIGEGGMGVVYMAEQKEPVRRRVALKIIKPGMDTRQVIARFEAERQALAMMDHPNIAKVLDAGATDWGRPYFVMELVNGLPVTKYCDEQHMTPKERLKLFVPICQAVQHAHQKGIIHRDIKPSNILVAVYDGQPVPKVIDFGVAKATSQSLTEKTMFTQLGQVVGTLEYMAPEQAERNQLDIDTRSDVYSLGVVLYELLTGQTPFDRQRLRSVAFDEMLRIIREEQPTKPSTKISTSESLPAIAANRRTEPAKLGNTIRGELDWIVMKALEKDRTQRYETASAFATDVEHYLTDEPVAACPPSAVYRFWKLARRKKTALMMSGLVLVILLTITVSLGWFARDREARQSQLVWQLTLILNDVDRLMQQSKWQEAMSVAKRAEALSAGGNPPGVAVEEIQETLRDLNLITRLQQVRAQVRTQAAGDDWNYVAADLEYARVFQEVAIDPADDQLRSRFSSLSVRVQLAAALNDWAVTRRRIVDENDVRTQRILRAASRLDPDPWRNQLRRSLASEESQGLMRLAEEADVAAMTAADISLLARALDGVNRTPQAVGLLRQAHRRYPDDFWINFDLAYCASKLPPPQRDVAVRYYQAALALAPQNAIVHNNLGVGLQRSGHIDEAVDELRAAIELNPAFALPHNNLAVTWLDQGQPERAIPELREAIRLAPTSAMIHCNLGVAQLRSGQVDRAIESCEKAVRLMPDYAPAHLNLGASLAKQGQLERALDCYQKAIELKPDYADAHYNLGLVFRDEGQLEKAVAAYREAIRLKPDGRGGAVYVELAAALVHLGRLDSALIEYRRALQFMPNSAILHNNYGLTLGRAGRLDDAIAQLQTAVALDPELAQAHYNLGFAMKLKGDIAAAIDEYRAAARLKPDYAEAHNNLAWELSTAADSELRDAQEAVEHAREAVSLRPTYGAFANTLGMALYRAGDYAEAINILEQSIESSSRGRGATFLILAMARWRIGDQDEARQCYQRAVEAIQTRPNDEEELQRLHAETATLLSADPKWPNDKVHGTGPEK